MVLIFVFALVMVAHPAEVAVRERQVVMEAPPARVVAAVLA
jgi:hypothetical protein